MQCDVMINFAIEVDDIKAAAEIAVFVCKLLADHGFEDAHGSVQPAQ